MGDYNHAEIEKKWQEYWDSNKTFMTPEKPGPRKLYCLDMFPYPSGAGLHVGHPLGYTATDIYSRFKRMNGFSVLHPMGFDAFGLPAELHATSTGEHPALVTEKNCQVFVSQMKKIGLSYDWDRQVVTTDPAYYRWTQWIFLKLYDSWFDEEQQKARPIEELPIPEEIRKRGAREIEQYRAQRRLAFYAESMVNWCPALGCVLANEEVIDGKSERGGFEVIRKPLPQWSLRITAYAERLLKDLDELDWPDNIREQQKNWIGKRFGAEIDFRLKGKDAALTCFTTRADTLFGVTFFVISPEHPLVNEVTSAECRPRVDKYREEAQKMSELARTLENRKKTGVFTGSFVVNPINGEEVPLYIGDYVLMSFGTGAVMGVPSHDERDFEFARTFELEIRPVIRPLSEDADVVKAVLEGEIPWTEAGTMLEIDSPAAREIGLANKLHEEGSRLITDWLEKNGCGRRVRTYKLRDWIFSRQRYWGEPIPMIHWEDGTVSAVDESQLPLLLPDLQDFKPADTGESPLAKASGWLEVRDPKTGLRGRRETNTMPNWAGSCWYYLRFIDPRNKQAPWDGGLEKSWMPVDLYVGGAEHAVLHLLYARFWHKVLYDLGYVSSNEPFKRLYNQGMIQAFAYKNRRGVLIPVDEVEERDDGKAYHLKSGDELERIVAKMSKSLRNVINPDQVIDQYGADTLRLYLMFMGPLDSSRVWDSKAIMGTHRFLRRAWTFVTGNADQGFREVVAPGAEKPLVLKAINKAIKRVSTDLEGLQFNTAISSLMEFLNEAGSEGVSRETLERFVLLLSPLAPHIGEELWQRLGHDNTLAYEAWPGWDEALLKEGTVQVVVQIGGKKRGLLEVSSSISEEELRKEIISQMAATPYPVGEGDQFFVVFQGGTKVPKLVNVVKK